MKIYTKTGDSGKTGLFGGERVDKNNLRLEAYGTIDELNSILGIILTEDIDSKTKEILFSIQNTLFVIGSELATPANVKSSVINQLTNDEITLVENWIDAIDEELEPLKNFILPGGSKGAANLHLARTVCRRAERNIISVNLIEKINPNIIVYVNRLSDLFFVLARFENHISSTPEHAWKPRG